MQNDRCKDETRGSMSGILIKEIQGEKETDSGGKIWNRRNMRRRK
jgi:hypothetical protein